MRERKKNSSRIFSKQLLVSATAIQQKILLRRRKDVLALRF